LEKVESFKYLGSTVNQNNEMDEVKERINAGSKGSYANKQMWQCTLLSKGS
jgi:hypothetical protein